MSDNYSVVSDDYQAKETAKNLKKKDSRYIKLQIVEQEIDEFNLLKIYLAIIMVVVCAKFIWDIVQLATDENESYFDLAWRLIQILGYGYGLQAHHTKNYVQAQILFYYMIFSFGMIAYYSYISNAQQQTLLFVWDILNFVVNLFIIRSVYKFVAALKTRDDLSRELQEAQHRGEFR